VVVDLSITNHVNVVVFIVERLLAPLEIHDAKAVDTETTTAIPELVSRAVLTTM
jgi:hypothetical protein